MNAFYVEYAFNFLIVLPAVVGVRRFRSLLPVDRVLVYGICAGLLAEMLAFTLALTIKNNIAVYNIYAIFDAFFLAQAFFNWGCLKRTPWIFRIVQLVLFIVWVMENHNKAGLLTPNELFPVLYSCVLVFMGIDRINAFIVSERGSLLANGRFILTLGIVISSSYEAFQAVVFWIYRQYSVPFYSSFEYTLEVAMVFVNVSLFFGMMRLPVRERFTLPAL